MIRQGRGPGRLEAHRRACELAGVTPDARAWEAGRQEGLRLYCRPAKAYEVAREGRAIQPGCTAAELTRMQPAYDWGRAYWQLELQRRDIIDDLRDSRYGAGTLPGPRFALILELQSIERRQRRYATWPPS